MKYHEIINIIKSRQSLYPAQMDATKTISKEDIWNLLEAANYAPSHKRTEPWRFIVFEGKAKEEFFLNLVNIYKEETKEVDFNATKVEKLSKRASEISHVIAIAMKRDEGERVPVQEEEYAVACSVQNILLSMKSLNIIGYWSSPKLVYSNQMKSFLGLSEQDKCMGFLQLGVPKNDLPEIPKKQMTGIEEKVSWRD